jgi:hypothetical protein
MRGHSAPPAEPVPSAATDSPFAEPEFAEDENRLGGLTEPAPAMYGHAELEGEANVGLDETDDIDADDADLVTSSEVSVDEVIAAEASVRTSVPSLRGRGSDPAAGLGMDTDPSELAAPDSTEAAAVEPAPPWVDADRPSHDPGQPLGANLLADLESLDDESDMLEDDQVELESADDEDEPNGAPPGLDSLSNMVERSHQQPPRRVPHIPVPPPAPSRPPPGTVPPPVPRTVPPAAPSKGASHTPIPPPPPPRRS